MSYCQDLVPLLQPSIQRRHSIDLYFGHKYPAVISNITLVHTSNDVESQA